MTHRDPLIEKMKVGDLFQRAIAPRRATASPFQRQPAPGVKLKFCAAQRNSVSKIWELRYQSSSSYFFLQETSAEIIILPLDDTMVLVEKNATIEFLGGTLRRCDIFWSISLERLFCISRADEDYSGDFQLASVLSKVEL